MHLCPQAQQGPLQGQAVIGHLREGTGAVMDMLAQAARIGAVAGGSMHDLGVQQGALQEHTAVLDPSAKREDAGDLAHMQRHLLTAATPATRLRVSQAALPEAGKERASMQAHLQAHRGSIAGPAAIRHLSGAQDSPVSELRD